jgi:hypothetical protein
VLFSATDGTTVTSSRMTLRVVQGSGGGGGGGGVPSGRPPNLRYNGLQGYNLFNGSQWDNLEFGATETRTFRANERVVIVVGSAILEDAVARDVYMMFDPFSGYPADPVVYGTSKTPTLITKPSNLQAFRFYRNVNGYNVFTYTFDLNNASSPTGINFYRNPAPNFYAFARYPLSIDIIDSQGTRFNTTDSVNITDTDGFMRQFPLIETYKDSGFTQKTTTFRSTDRVYVAVSVATIDATGTDAVTFGSVQLRDFQGGVQIFRSFVNGRDSNPPLCPPTGTCGPPPARALVANVVTITYRFMINLSLADGDPWIDGSQFYALSIALVDDFDETYGGLTSQLLIIAPLFRLDVVGGNSDTTGPAWGTHDYGYYYENLNALDKWRKSRFEYCGLPGSGQCKNMETHAVAFLDGEGDGDLDIADSIRIDANSAEINYYRRQVDFDGNVIFSKFNLLSMAGAGVYCNDIATGDLTGDGKPEIVCGMTDGRLVYFLNDGSWTTGTPAAFVAVDTTRTQQIWGVTIGDFDNAAGKDLAVARSAGGAGTVTYYLNINGLGQFSTGGITDRWRAEAEVSLQGTVEPGDDFFRTIESDDTRERVNEAHYTVPAETGNTTNSELNTSAAPWAYADWVNDGDASGSHSGSGGNPGGRVQVQMNCRTGAIVAGFWQQSFTVSGSAPYTAAVTFHYRVSAFGGSTVSIYAFVDPTNVDPTLGTEIAPAITHSSVTLGWNSSGTITVPSSRLPAPGTYWLKIAARTTNGGSCGTTTVLFDNMRLAWSSSSGVSSQLQHYWRIQQLPNRPSSTFSLRFEAQRTANPEGDNFAIAYSIDVTGVDPTTGTYTTILWVNTSSDLGQAYAFTQNLQNRVVWIRAIDLDHRVGNESLDILAVDQMYIEVSTSPISPGSDILLPSTPGDAKAIDSDDQDSDGYGDLVVGTSNGKVYRMFGFAGGLQTPSGTPWHTVGGNPAISGIKFANISASSNGLEIALSYTTNVLVITGGTAFAPIKLITAPPPTGLGPTAATINALAAGDVDGDGDDDIVVATQTAGPALVYFRNLEPTGAQWTSYRIEPIPTGTTIYIWDLDLGDGDKSQYRGR